MRWPRSVVSLAVAGLAAGSWGANALVDFGDTAAAAATGTALTPQEAMAGNAADHDGPADRQWDASSEVAVRLTGTSATSSSSDVVVSGGTVTVRASGTYRFSGTLSNGSIVVDTTQAGIVRLVLDGVTVSNSTGSPLRILDADEAMVVLAEGTTNKLSDAAQYASTEQADAALFSRSDLTVIGTGSLTVTGNASDAVGVKAGLVIDATSLTVHAADDGIRAKSYVVLDGGSITVESTGDGIKATDDADATRGYVSVVAGTLTVTSGQDAVSAASDVVLSGGTATLKTGQGSDRSPGETSIKGLKADASVVVGGTARVSANCSDDAINSAVISVTGGTLDLATYDDGMHADEALFIAGGTVTVTTSYEALEGLRVTISGGTVDVTSRDDAINAVEKGLNEFAVAPNAGIFVSGGTVVVNSTVDGLDSNGKATISGGTIVVNGPSLGSPGEGALDVNGTLSFTGGTVLATGTYASTSAPSTSGGQGWISASLSSALSAGTVVHITAADGSRIVSLRTSKSIKAIIFSSSRITQGQTYAVRTGGSVSGTRTGGMYSSGDLSGSTQLMTVTAGQHSGGMGPGWPGWPGTTPTAGPTATPTTSPTSSNPGSAGCTAVHSVVNEWSGGFQGQVTVTAGSKPISGWTVTWTYTDGRVITQFWNASITTSGSTVKAQNVSHNGSLTAGGTTSFGFTGTQNGTAAAPSLSCTAS